MNSFKSIYLKFERYFAERPWLFFAISTLLASTVVGLDETLRGIVMSEYTVRGYVILGVTLLVLGLLVPVIIAYRKMNFRNQVLLQLEELSFRLSQSFEVNGKKYYPGEILECYHTYSILQARLMSRYPKRFANLPIRLEPPHPFKKDWVAFEVVQALRTDIDVIIQQLKK